MDVANQEQSLRHRTLPLPTSLCLSRLTAFPPFPPSYTMQKYGIFYLMEGGIFPGLLTPLTAIGKDSYHIQSLIH